MRRHMTRQLLRAQPVHQQRQVRAVLLDGAQREDDARSSRARRAGALGQANHQVACLTPLLL
jgi:hypothetical protein